MTLAFEKHAEGATHILAFRGRIDRADLPDLGKALLAEINGGCRSLLIDFAEVEHLHNEGLARLVAAAKRLPVEIGQFVVTGPLQSDVQELFERADLSRHMRLAPSRRAGMQWLAQRRWLGAKARLARKLLSERTEPTARRKGERRRRDLQRLSRLAARILDADSRNAGPCSMPPDDP